MEPLLLKVTSIRRATPSTRIVRLSLGGGQLTYRAGQAALLGIPGHPEPVPYSIASAPAETKRHGWLEFLIKLESKGWGEHLAGLRRGALVEVSGPLGSFGLPEHAPDTQFVFVAGGTGIAPLRAMICEALSVHPAASLHLLYSARTPADFAYLPELRHHARRGELELSLTTTREVPPRWRGQRGRITSAQLAPLVRTPDALCFVCGPASMVDEVPRMLVELGIPRGRIRLEEW